MELEKNNRLTEIINKIKSCRNCIISLHASPDGDSLGSSLAMKYVLEKIFGLNVTLISYDSIGETYNLGSLSNEILFGKDILDFHLVRFDALITLDCGSANLIGKFKEDTSFLKEIYTINIDHHRTNEHYGNLNYVKPDYISTCSLLIDIFKELGISFDRELSKRLILGICTDSNFFRIEGDLTKSFEDISFLIKNGADYYNDVLKVTWSSKPLRIKKYFAFIINKMKIKKKIRLGYSIISRQDTKTFKLKNSELKLGINDLNDIKELDVVAIIVETDDRITGSIRSKRGFDISSIARELGGGGNPNAAAFRLKNLTLKEAESLFLKKMKKFFTNRSLSN